MIGFRYISFCSGIEAATVAWHPLRWEPVAFAEIDRFPSAVLRHHYPDVPNHGDFTTMEGDEYGSIDLAVAGTPCQDFSVAGLRAGMDGKRGQLTVEFAHLAHRLAARAGTRWLVWENVPGVLSIDGGEAFATFLGILAGRAVRVPAGGWQNSGVVAGAVDGFGLCYRVLDAQHFGVPQRRRRVFVVGYFGDWRRAAAVLLERHSLSGHPAPRRETRQVDPTIPARRTGGGGLGSDFDCDGGLVTGTVQAFGGNNCSGSIEVATALNACATASGRMDFESETFIAHSLRAEGFDASEDGTGRGTPLVPVGTYQNTGQGWWNESDRATTLRTPEGGGSLEANLVAFTCKDHGADAGELAPTLRSMGHDASHQNGGGQVAVAYGIDEEQNGFGCLKARREGGGFEGAVAFEPGSIARDAGPRDLSYQVSTLRADMEDNQPAVLTPAMAVRRLTPRECERLQGFPDDYTKISDKTADGPRYKALGNSMAVPVMAWMGKRVEMVDELGGEL